jgi:hypothetical protein
MDVRQAYGMSRIESGMSPISRDDAGLLASAYELRTSEVADDAATVQQSTLSDSELETFLQQRHGWTVASEYARHYLADLRRFLLPH